MNSDYLYHHGILGQKWGVRRFQNEDRTLTPAGKERYRKNSSTHNPRDDKKEAAKKIAKTGLAVAGTAALAYGGYKLATSDAAKEFAASQKVRVAMAKKASLLNLHKMDGRDLNAAIDRLEKEEKLRSLTYKALTSSADPKKQMAINSGRKILEAAVAGVASYAGYAALSGKFDRRQASGYIFPNPNQKKNK